MSAPSGGARVATGRLRVDAARAVHKLRDYQLPDRTMWVLEVVRAGVASNAESIFVRGDSDDVWVGWEGEPIDAAAMPRLLDELVDPAPSAERRALRLLATGLNTALGADPRWVDVYRAERGEGLRVRYTPGLLEPTQDDEAAGLRRLSAETWRLPPEAPARGVLVHLRRLPVLGSLPLMIGFGEPAELTVARAACDDIAVPLTIGSTGVGRDRSHHDLLRLPLGDGVAGFVAVVDPSAAVAGVQLHLAELGVMLTRYQLVNELVAAPRAKVPLRVFVDAPRMPTNASRAAVRLDEPPMPAALERARARIPDAVARLARELSPKAERRWGPVEQERLRAAAVTLLASKIAGAAWRRELAQLDEKHPIARSIAGLPLLRDALGRPRSPSSFPIRDGSDVVHFAREPVSADLEPWLGHVLWIPPGDPAMALLGEWRAPSSGSLISSTRGWKRARNRFLAEAERPPAVASAAWQILSVPLRAPGKSLRSALPPGVLPVPDLDGEVVLLDPRRARGSAVGLRVEGRELELWQPKLPFPITAVASSKAMRPAPDYRTVRRDEAFAAVARAVRGGAVVACEALALRLARKSKPGDRAEVRAKRLFEGDGSDRDALEHVVRAGIDLALDLRAEVDAMLPVEGWRKSPLATAPVFRDIAGERWSLDALARHVRSLSGALCLCTSRARARSSPAHPVFRADREERAVLERALAPAVVVDYDDELARAQLRSAPELALSISEGAALGVEGEEHAVAITWTAGKAELELRHLGRKLDCRSLAGTLVPCRVVLDDAAIVPNATWSGVHHHERKLDVEGLERSLARALVAHLAGEPNDALCVTTAWPASAVDALLEALGKTEDPVEWLGREALGRLLDVPLILRIGSGRLHSLRSVQSSFEATIPYVGAEAASGGEAGDYAPPILRSGHAALFARLLGRPFELAEDELARRRVLMRRQRALDGHRSRPLVPAMRAWTEPVVDLQVRTATSARFGLAPILQSGARIDVLIEGRPFTEWSEADELSVRGLVDLPESDADETFSGLSSSAQSKLRGLVTRAADALLSRVAATAPTALVTRPDAWALLRQRSGRSWTIDGGRTLAELRRAPAFATVQGPYVALADLPGAIRVAVFEGEWLAPLGGAHELDAAVLRAPDDDQARAAFMEVLGRIERDRHVIDVSAAVSQLQAERRIEQGLAAAPRIAGPIDPRLRFGLSALLAEEAEALATLGLGEAALVPDGPTRIDVCSVGRVVASVTLDLVPYARVACESPLVRRGRFDETASLPRLREAIRAVIARAVRRAVDAIPGAELPEWLRRTLRASALMGGALHLERLIDTPLFETTAGEWVTPGALRAQAESLGAVWWTALREPLEPLDPARLALVLEPADAQKLAGFVEVVEATEELRLDQQARANMARPAVGSLEPSEAELAQALAVERLGPEGDDPSRGTVVVLRPGAEALRGLRAHREMKPLGALPDPSRWPALAILEDPRLKPNRIHAAPEEDAVLAGLRGRVRRTVDRALAAMAPFPAGKLVAMRVRAWMELASLDDGAVEGVAWLESSIAPGVVTLVEGSGVRTLAPRTERGAALPLHGKLWISGRATPARLAGALEAAYSELISRLMDRGQLSEAALSHVLVASSVTAIDPREHRAGGAALPMMEPPMTLRELGEHLASGGLVTLVPSAERARAEAAGSKKPWLLDDGALPSSLLVHILGARAVDLRRELAGRVLGEDGAEAPVTTSTPASAVHVPIVPPASAAPSPSPPPRRERALVTAIREQLERLGVYGSLVRAIHVAPRKKPCVSLGEGTLVLAGRHPVVAEALEAADAGDASAPARARLLCAHIVGLCHREAGAIGTGSERGLMIDLL